MNRIPDLPEWLHRVLKEKAQAVLPKNGVLDLVQLSEASAFYDRQFKPKQEIPDQGASPASDQPGIHCSDARAPWYMREILQTIEAAVGLEAVVVELGGGQYQQRSGCAFRRFAKYVPLDISAENMAAYSRKYRRPSIACDATQLPFKDSSIDVIFTHTFLEHPHRPDCVTEEIVRVLKPGGWVFHADAWNCRWWQRYGFQAHDFRFNRGEFRLIIKYLGYWVYENARIYRLHFFIRRMWSLFTQETLRPKELPFTPLIPNYDLKLYSDEDAAASLDPVVVGNFYRKRGFIASHSLLKGVLGTPRFISAQKRRS